MTTPWNLSRLLALALLALAAGCSSTRIATTWKDPADQGPPMRKLAIFVEVKDDTLRRMAETRAAQTMPEGSAVPGFTLFDTPQPDVQKMRERLAREGFDGAIVARLVSYDRQQVYHPPQTHLYWPDPLPVYSGRHRGYYWYYPQPIFYTTPAYVSENEEVIVETTLYRLPEGKAVWRAVSESFNPASRVKLVDEIVDAVGKELQGQGLIALR